MRISLIVISFLMILVGMSIDSVILGLALLTVGCVGLAALFIDLAAR